MCYPLGKSTGFGGRINEVGRRVIARNGAVATEELSGRAIFDGPLSLCLLICEGRGGGQRRPGLDTDHERSVSEPGSALEARGREASTPGPWR